MKVAECFHPSEFILDEMAEREWDRDILSRKMIRDDRDSLDITRLTIDFYLDVGLTNRDVTIDADTSDQLGHAFGCGSEFFMDLQQSYRDWLKWDKK